MQRKKKKKNDSASRVTHKKDETKSLENAFVIVSGKREVIYPIFLLAALQ